MKKIGAISVMAATLSFAAGAVLADPDEDNLVINEEIQMTTETTAPEHMEWVDTIYSGWRFRTNETQAFQMDDFDNPAMLTVDKAIDAFSTVEGSEGLSCASCHAGPEDFAGLTASMPRIVNGQVLVMEDLLNSHRQEVMGAEPLKWSGQEMQGMIALIGLQSRGMPVDVQIDGEAEPFWQQGKDMYYTRYGQLELSCANCHEDSYGRMIRADHLSQGQTNGFPTYRLKQARLISVHNRFRGCIRDTRAMTFSEGSDEFKALELYVRSRSNGLSIETPAVRQ